MKKVILTILVGLVNVTANANAMGSIVCATRNADIIVKYSFFRSEADEYATATVLLEMPGSSGIYTQLADNFSTDSALASINIALPSGKSFKVIPAKDLSKCEIKPIKK